MLYQLPMHGWIQFLHLLITEIMFLHINEEFNQELMDDLELDEKDDFWCSSSLGPNGSFNYRDYNDMTDLISDYGQKIIDTSPYRIAEYKDWVEKEKIGPLVRVKWNQNTPYNNMCNDNLVNFRK